ncbi:MAG TPA: XTP/dITP diphosphatase [Chthoniobacterales bacterium]|jgi:XTP/dITP diphosphohydrolase|nr:XTP/dITP diphosphatase [Chthoniobacterales bacterium]
MDLLLATGNTHKSREFQKLLGDDFQISDLSSLPALEMPEETGSTFEQNAVLKAVSVSKVVDQLIVADDSGLEVHALGGAPGIYSARYAGEHARDSANIDKLLRKMKDVAKRSARFRCVIALARSGDVVGTFEGLVEGEIVDPPRGTGGFGYDPVFQPTGFEKTFAEMASESKNQISHRAKAITRLRKALCALGN